MRATEVPVNGHVGAFESDTALENACGELMAQIRSLREQNSKLAADLLEALSSLASVSRELGAVTSELRQRELELAKERERSGRLERERDEADREVARLSRLVERAEIEAACKDAGSEV